MEGLIPCPCCDGYGAIVSACWVYEPGCAFGHADTEERPCPACDGDGRVWEECEPAGDWTDNDDFRGAPWGEHSQFGVGA